MANIKKLADLIAEARQAMKKECFSSILASNFFLAEYLLDGGVEMPVRCKDCIYREKDDIGRNCCSLIDCYVGETDYCSRGERDDKK